MAAASIARIVAACDHAATENAILPRYFVVPTPALQPYVDRLWGWESACALPLPTILPGTGAELMFHYGDPVFLRLSTGETLDPGPAFLPGSRGGPRDLLARGSVGFISVRFRSGALRHFCPVPMAELDAQPLTVGDVWGRAGRELAARIAGATHRAERVAWLESWLLACLERHGKAQPLIDMAVRALYYGHREVRIDALAETLALSRRHFERQFKTQLGVSPKSFQRRARFQHTVRDLALGGDADYLAHALDHGYYDQAHFIHEFQAYAGQSPGHYLQTTRRVAHFYNAPLFVPDKVPLPR